MATNAQLAWLKTMVCPAQMSQSKWGVPASVTLAQCILESSWGQSQLTRRCNNYFGVKAMEGDDYAEFATDEVIQGRTVVEQAKFRRYPSAIESFSAHARLLATLERYAPAMRHSTDPTAFASALRMCGYSTNPRYALQLLELMHEFNLEHYDILPPPDQPAAQETA